MKLAIKPYYQRKDINKDEYKDILRKAVHKVNIALRWPWFAAHNVLEINIQQECFSVTKSVFTTQICHSRTGEINPVKVNNLVKLYVQRYKYFRKHGRKMDEEEKEDRESASMHSSTWLDKDCLFLSIWSNKFAKSLPLHVFGPTVAIEWQLFVLLFCSPLCWHHVDLSTPPSFPSLFLVLL